MYKVHEKFMFWNDWMLESIRGLKRVINKPVKSSNNPIFDEPICYVSVIYDQESKIFKMWYDTLKAPLPNRKDWGLRGLAYTTSSDGFIWERPALGIVEYEGSKENNLTDMEEGEMGCVYLDKDDLNPERRYKMVYSPWEKIKNVGEETLAVSKDGLHWRKGEFPVILPFRSDAFNAIIYNSTIQKYIVFSRPATVDRRVAVSLSGDLKNWDGPYTVLEPEEIQTHFYWFIPLQYEGICVGFIPVFKTEEYEIKSAAKMDGPVHTELCYSSNGISWQRIQPGNAWIPHGEPGEFDAGGVYPMAAVVVGNEIRIYYEGTVHQHSEVREDREDCRLGVATLRRDGFISLDAGEEEGSVTTRITCSWTHAKKRRGGIQWTDLKKGEVRANVKTEENGYLKAELLDEHWNVIDGYSRRESIPVVGDHFDTILRWREKTKMEPPSKLFRVRLLLKNAKFYSISFT